MPDPRIWKKWILILEACEYKEHFLMYDSSVTVTTNLTHDHHDYYPTSESYDAAFCAMWKKTTDSIIIPIGDQGLVNMTQKIEKNIIMSNTRKGTFDHVVGDFR
jgi:UDP-N-acetylmuramate--alanine ligase